MWILSNDLARQLPELAARLEPEIVVEAAPRVLVDLERLRVPSAAIEREHELRDEPFAVGVLADEHLQFADDRLVMSEIQLRVEAQLERAQPRLLETLSLRASRRSERDVGESRPVPECQRTRRQYRREAEIAFSGSV